jgi:hypothetical protein
VLWTGQECSSEVQQSTADCKAIFLPQFRGSKAEQCIFELSSKGKEEAKEGWESSDVLSSSQNTGRCKRCNRWWNWNLTFLTNRRARIETKGRVDKLIKF